MSTDDSERFADLLAPHEMVAKLLADDDTDREPLTFTGYSGPSADDGSVRLYRSLSLDSYWDIPRDVVIDVKEVGTSGCVRITVKHGGTVRKTRVGVSRRNSSAALAGNLMSAALKGHGGPMAPTPGGTQAILTTIPCLVGTIVGTIIIAWPSTIDPDPEPEPPI